MGVGGGVAHTNTVGFNGSIGSGADAVVSFNSTVADNCANSFLFDTIYLDSGNQYVTAFGAGILLGIINNVTTFNASVVSPSWDSFIVGKRSDPGVLVQNAFSVLCQYGGIGYVSNTVGILGLVDDGATGSITIKGNLAALATDSIAMLGSVNTNTQTSIAIGYQSWVGKPDFGSPGGNDIAIGAGARVSQSYSSIAIGPSSHVGIDSSGHGADNAIAIGREAIVGDACHGSIAIGYGAHATASGEAVIGNSVLPITKFHVAASATDLVAFDVAAMVSNLDSSMYLLYKNTAGTVVLNKVLVEAVTGYLHVPA